MKQPFKGNDVVTFERLFQKSNHLQNDDIVAFTQHFIKSDDIVRFDKSRWRNFSNISKKDANVTFA